MYPSRSVLVRLRHIKTLHGPNVQLRSSFSAWNSNIGSRICFASSQVVDPGMIPAQHGSMQSRLPFIHSINCSSALYSDKVAKGVKLGSLVGVDDEVGKSVQVCCIPWVCVLDDKKSEGGAFDEDGLVEELPISWVGDI